MALAETAQLLVKLTLQDDASPTAGKVKTSLTDMGKTALSVAGAAGFGALAAGALQAQEAQGKFMAATGASREEAQKFVSDMDGLAGSVGTVGMKFSDVAALGTTVSQQFKTTGQDTIDLTENIAEFARVTGGDANQAAGDLDDTLSAYGLSADDAAGFMDKLVLSNQKFGTDIGPQALQVMRDLAPAITAAGGDADDAVGFMNAFETSLGGAEGTAKALRTAVLNLKPGQTIDDLITQVGSIEDPLLRAQKAAEIFGKAAGPKMAEVIKPGMTSLDDFKVSADDAKGAVGTAAESMNTDADKIRGIFDKLAAGARELGQDFGPALTGLASLGSLIAPLASGLGDVIKNVAAKILPQATAAAAARGTAEAAAEAAAMNAASTAGAGGVAATAGTALGVGFGAAALVAIQHGLPALGSLMAEQIAGTDSQSQARSAGTQYANAVMTGATDAAKADFVKRFMDAVNAGQSWDEAAKTAGAQVSSSIATSAAAHAADDQREAGVAANFATSFANDTALKNAGIQGASVIANSPAWTQAGNEAAGSTTDAFYAYWSHQGVSTVRTAAGDAAQAFSSKVLSERGTAQSAWQDFVDMMKHPLDTAAEIAELKGDLASKKMIKGLSSNDPQTRQWAENTRDAIQQRIDDLEKLLGQDGTDAGNSFTNHLSNAGADAIAEAKRIAEKVNDWLNTIKNNIVVNIDVNDRTGQGDTAHGHRAEGGPVRKGVAYIVGEKRPELFIPEANGQILPRLPQMSQPHPYTGGVMQIPPINLRPQIQISAREVATQTSHYQVLAGGRLPVSRV